VNLQVTEWGRAGGSDCSRLRRSPDWHHRHLLMDIQPSSEASLQPPARGFRGGVREWARGGRQGESDRSRTARRARRQSH